MKSKSSFKHESLLAAEDVKGVLDSISQALVFGQLTFEEGKGELNLHPEGLLYLKIKASDEDGRQQVDIRVRWDRVPKALDDEPPVIRKG